jgi:hypothetical protein
MRSTLGQSSLGSNCSLAQWLSEAMSPTFLAWPTMLRKVRRGVRAMPVLQRRRVAKSSMLRA